MGQSNWPWCLLKKLQGVRNGSEIAGAEKIGYPRMLVTVGFAVL